MKRNFSNAAVLRAIEDGYGVSVRALKALDGHAHSFNFRAETADGEVFEVKCFPAVHEERFKCLVAHTAPSDNHLAATRLFGGKILGFDGWKVIALRWVSGSERGPDELSDAELDAFLAAYAEFQRHLSDDGAVLPVRDYLALKRMLLKRLHGGNAPGIVRELNEMRDDTLTLAAEHRRIIHGDLHKGNLRFDAGTVSGFFDLEELRFGTPTEDLVRYVVCREEHWRWYDPLGRRRLLVAFRRILTRTSYTRGEWLFAINGCLLRKLAKKVKSNRLPVWRRINLRARMVFYHALRDAVEREVANG